MRKRLSITGLLVAVAAVLLVMAGSPQAAAHGPQSVADACRSENR